MLADDDEIELKHPSNKLLDKIRRHWLSIVIVNDKVCKAIGGHLRSYDAVQKEKQRHVRNYPMTIHPFSRLR